MNLNKRNYYSKKANKEFLSVSQYKDFCGSLGHTGCEARAMAKIRGEWSEEPSTAMLIGSYVDAYFEGTLKSFKKRTPQIFKKDGGLKKDFEKAEEIIKSAESDPYFMKYMSGQKQVIMTAEMFGALWKIKLDFYFSGKCIVDGKVIKDINERFWVKDFGYTNFVDFWGYDIQGAVYQAVVEKNTGKKLPFYLAAIDKGNVPDKEIIYIDDEHLRAALLEVERNVPRILELKAGKIKPDRCEKCDYCKSTKKLTGPVHYSQLIEV